ncbi:hypothetical protein ABZ584_28295 [Streptomyces antibioticus]|uniref:hypothetical protein n=1 Tax=Streptomyces antibioticus TaxID=1890 RepID=UPI0004C4CD48
MSTGVIIALIVIVAVVVAVVAVLAVRARGSHGGGGLKRRFGPEYDRAVARHDGDVQAAERELAALVERHGGLRERPLEPAERERYEARWTATQEHFVDSPREAVAEADRLVAELAGARGFPDAGQYEEQVAALSVHHARHVQGYRSVHRLAGAQGKADGRADGSSDAAAPGTEDLRGALLEARALFEDLLAPARGELTSKKTETTTTATARHDDHGRHLPRAFQRHQPKES